LAQQLVRSDPDAAIVRTGAVEQAADSATAAATIPAATPQGRAYNVQRGETLTSIARKFQCDMRELARANAIKAPRYMIRPGQRLTLAGCRQ